jgi:hypothetical protein
MEFLMRCLVTSTGLLRLVPALIFSAALVHAGQNLAINASFENIGTDGADTSYGPAASPPDSPSAADSWMVWNSAILPLTLTQPTTSTAYCVNASVDVNCKSGNTAGGFQPNAIDGTHTLHVTTNAANSGIFQAFLPANTGPQSVVWSLWIYVVTGQVDAAVGNDGGTFPDRLDQFTTTTGQWQQLTSQNDAANSPANEITIYSVNRGAEFFVDAVDIDIPEPGTVFGAASALLLLAGYGLRRR